jgi:S-adenosylmethionine:tRNA ribosyltransferase-isomerase
MRAEEFDYPLPPASIAQDPAARRDASRLMVVDRARSGGVEESPFAALVDRLAEGDLLVLNDTRVFPARLRTRKPTGGRIDLLLVERRTANGAAPAWSCMVSSGRGLKPGARLAIGPGFEAQILGEAERGRFWVRLLVEGMTETEALDRFGLMPLPPYIRREPGDPRSDLDRERYQTIYASESGAVAAPTAGLHFTPELFGALEDRGVRRARLTLHVGPGTFQPLRAGRVEDHHLEAEEFVLPAETAEAIAACRARRGRVVAVGTTVTRVLEARAGPDGTVSPGRGRCDLFILPGHRFRAVDALITNFHLPRSTLLVLVAAFAGRERILSAYAEALARGFRFYSYGDAMLIL